MPLAIQRRFTRAGESPYAAIEFRLATSEIRSPDGSVVFRLDALEAPAAWSQVAINLSNHAPVSGVPLGWAYAAALVAGVGIAVIVLADLLAALAGRDPPPRHHEGAAEPGA